MPSWPNVTTGDEYKEYLTPGAHVLTLQVSNAAIYFQLGTGRPYPIWESEQRFQLPPGRSMAGNPVCDGVRIRSAVPGLHAQVSIDTR